MTTATRPVGKTASAFLLVAGLLASSGTAIAAAPGTTRYSAGGVEVPECNGLAATIVGSSGPDEILGTPGADVIVGLGGDDAISGQGGADVICGGPGNDLLLGNGGDDVIRGGSGVDRVREGPGADQLFGGRDLASVSARELTREGIDRFHSGGSL